MYSADNASSSCDDVFVRVRVCVCVCVCATQSLRTCIQQSLCTLFLYYENGHVGGLVKTHGV